MLEEAEIQSLVKHENVLDLIGICIRENIFQIITPFRSQGSLDKFLRGDSFRKEICKKYFGWVQLHFCYQIAEVIRKYLKI
jgi:hypothetical protein